MEKENFASSPACITQRTCCLHENPPNGKSSPKTNVQVQTDWAGTDLPAWNAIDFYHQTEPLEDEELIEEEQEMEYEVYILT